MPNFAELGGALPAFGAAMVLSVSAVGAILLLRLRYGARARLRRRLMLVTGNAAVAARRSDEGRSQRRHVQEKLREIEAQQRRPRRRNVLRRLVREAGLSLSVQRYFILSGMFAAVCAAAMWAAGIHLAGSIVFGLAIGLALPRWLLGFLGKRRRRQFTRHFAGALDTIVRGIQSGLPVEECFGIIARESPDPVGPEFALVVEGQRLGLRLDEALQRAYERIPTPEVKFFATVLSIQKQTGGNLSETLSNLSAVLRDRHRMASKVRALSSEARASATIIAVLPMFVGALIFLVNSKYISLLFSDPIGHMMLGGAALIMALGTFVMKRMVSFEI
jgi:tight adherence protein B